jgi:two-component sensor histidine kinase
MPEMLSVGRLRARPLSGLPQEVRIRLSLSRRLLALVLAALLPMLAVLVYNEAALRESRARELGALALSAAQQAALEIERLTTGTEGILRTIASARSVRTFDAPACDAFLRTVAPQLPQLVAIAVFDLDGFSRCRSDGRVVPDSYANRTYFQNALAAPGTLVVGEFTPSRATGTPGLPIAIALLDDSGAPVGVIATSIDLGWLGGVLRERQLAQGASLTIADRNGTIIAREPLPEQFIGTVIPEAYRYLVHAPQAGSIELTSQDGTRRILGYIPVDEAHNQLYVSAGIGREQAFAAVDAATERSLMLAGIATLVALALAWALGRSLVRGPVRRISSTLARRRQGDERARTGMSAADGEIEALGATVDAYMDELNRGREAREQAERTRDLMAQELSHRMKNMIATIQAIAHQTLRGAGLTPGSFEAFNSRLIGIGRAQELLSSGASRDVTLREVLASAVGLFEPAPGTRFGLAGPDILLRSRAALSLAMAIHELSTNAVKYGALSVEGGHVDIAWRVLPGEPRLLQLSWIERGGPPVRPPSHRGFGSKMVEGVLAGTVGGRAVMTFAPEGLRCTLEMPLTDTVGEEIPGAARAA